MGDKRSRAKRIAFRGCLALCVASLAGIGWLAFQIASALHAKESAPMSSLAATPRSEPAQPITQLESHTCGFLALSAAYRVFGLSPDDKNLRFRLGVDRPANPADSSSAGTLHPDLFRVLMQDGFSFRAVDPAHREAEPEMCRELADGGVALVLIRRRESGRLHWVASDACVEGSLRVVDSLRAEGAYEEPAAAYLRECAVSVLLIRPLAVPQTVDLHRAYVDGLREMRRALARLDALPPRAE